MHMMIKANDIIGFRATNGDSKFTTSSVLSMVAMNYESSYRAVMYHLSVKVEVCAGSLS